MPSAIVLNCSKELIAHSKTVPLKIDQTSKVIGTYTAYRFMVSAAIALPQGFDGSDIDLDKL
jgi:hypothetical protein